MKSGKSSVEVYHLDHGSTITAPWRPEDEPHKRSQKVASNQTPAEGDHKVVGAIAICGRVVASNQTPSEGDHKGLHPTSAPLPPLL